MTTSLDGWDWLRSEIEARLLGDEPVVCEAPNGRYVQFAVWDDRRILGEVSGNAYLDPAHHLGGSQRARVLGLGFEPPSAAGGSENYARLYQTPAEHGLAARHAVEVLRAVFAAVPEEVSLAGAADFDPEQVTAASIFAGHDVDFAIQLQFDTGSDPGSVLSASIAMRPTWSLRKDAGGDLWERLHRLMVSALPALPDTEPWLSFETPTGDAVAFYHPEPDRLLLAVSSFDFRREEVRGLLGRGYSLPDDGDAETLTKAFDIGGPQDYAPAADEALLVLQDVFRAQPETLVFRTDPDAEDEGD